MEKIAVHLFVVLVSLVPGVTVAASRPDAARAMQPQGSSPAPEVPLPGASVIELVTHRQPDQQLLTVLSGDQRLIRVMAGWSILTSDWTVSLAAGDEKTSTPRQHHIWHAGGEVKPHWKKYDTSNLDQREKPASMSVDLDEVRRLGGLDDVRADRVLSIWGLSNARRVDVALVRGSEQAQGLSPRLDLNLRVAPRSIPPEGDHERPWLTLSSKAKLPADLEPLARAAAWHTILQTDAKGLGAIGPRGGSGSLAGLARQLAESRYLLGPESDERWSQQHSTWRSQSEDALRIINQSSRQEVVLAGVRAAGGANMKEPGVLIVIPLREGASPEKVEQALATLAVQMGLNAPWQQTAAGPKVSGAIAVLAIGEKGAGVPMAMGVGTLAGPVASRFVWIGLGESATSADGLFGK